MSNLYSLPKELLIEIICKSQEELKKENEKLRKENEKFIKMEEFYVTHGWILKEKCKYCDVCKYAYEYLECFTILEFDISFKTGNWCEICDKWLCPNHCDSSQKNARCSDCKFK